MFCDAAGSPSITTVSPSAARTTIGASAVPFSTTSLYQEPVFVL